MARLLGRENATKNRGLNAKKKSYTLMRGHEQFSGQDAQTVGQASSLSRKEDRLEPCPTRCGSRKIVHTEMRLRVNNRPVPLSAATSLDAGSLRSRDGVGVSIRKI